MTLIELHVRASGKRVSYAASAITVVADMTLPGAPKYAEIRVDGLLVDVMESYDEVVGKLRAAQ